MAKKDVYVSHREKTVKGKKQHRIIFVERNEPGKEVDSGIRGIPDHFATLTELKQYVADHRDQWELDANVTVRTFPFMDHIPNRTFENKYAGKSPSQVWDAWKPVQRQHFMIDHGIYDVNKEGKQLSAEAKKKYVDVNLLVRDKLKEHVDMGQYEKGGVAKRGDMPLIELAQLINQQLSRHAADDKYYGSEECERIDEIIYNNLPFDPETDEDAISYCIKATPEEILRYDMMRVLDAIAQTPKAAMGGIAGRDEEFNVDIDEMKLYLENDGHLYQTRLTPLYTNLMTKMARGTYDHSYVPQSFKHIVDVADKKYQKEMDQSPRHGGYILSSDDRKKLAEVLANDFQSAAQRGEHNNFLPAKYQKKTFARGGVATTSWKKNAVTELNAQTGFKLKASDMELPYSLEDDGFYARSKDHEFLVFKNATEAHHFANRKVKDDLESEPELFSKDFLENHIYVTDTDRRIMAGEEADNATEDMDQDSEEYTETHDRVYNEWYEGLVKPIVFLVEEHGLYSTEDLMKASFIRIDEEAAAKDAVNIDGVAHFLASYDGEEIELPSGAVAYRVN